MGKARKESKKKSHWSNVLKDEQDFTRQIRGSRISGRRNNVISNVINMKKIDVISENCECFFIAWKNGMHV